MKSTFVAYLLWFFLGGLGAHRFYLGRPISAILFILTLGGRTIWWIIDLFLIPGMVQIANMKHGGGSNQNTNTNTNVINVQVGETKTTE